MKLLKNFQNLFLTLVISLIISSCETDFELNAGWEDITIVYGILNQNDSIHYLRIQKAFLGEGNVLHMALEPDSNLYPPILDVVIEEWSNNTYLRTMEFDTISVQKDSGTFFYPNQLLYHTHAQLNQSYLYKLKITNKKTGKVISSEADLINRVLLTRPRSMPNPIAINFDTVPSRLETFTFAWDHVKNAGRYQMLLRFNYLEANTDTNDTILKNIEWHSPIIRSGNLALSQEVEVKFNKQFFFTLVSNNLEKLDNVIRYPKNFEVIIYAAANELSNFIEVNAPSSSLVQERPEYTNIVNGLGIFSARVDGASVHAVHDFTINRLKNMEGYNFQRLGE